MPNANVQEVKLSDEGHKLALEQTHRVLAADRAAAQRYLEEARRAKEVADRKYVTAIKRLLALAKPDLAVEDDAVLDSNATEYTITVRHEPHPAAPPALKAKKGGKR